MRIKIVEPGWETFSDEIAGFKFTNAVSDGDIPDHVLKNLSASLRVLEFAEEGEGRQLGFAAARVDINSMPAPIEKPCPHIPPAPQPKRTVAHVSPVVSGNKRYTFDELADIADQDGIKGLREVATPLGISARSINDMIDAILKYQKRLDDEKARAEAAQVESKAKTAIA